MAYFSNGREGADYENHYCVHCVHGGKESTCAVWLAHLIANYAECNKKDSVLHVLIPRTKDGLDNEQCRMFLQVKAR